MERLRIGATTLAGRALEIESMEQRNWSLVASGRETDGSRVFVKQFVDAAGIWHPDHLDNEVSGLRSLADLGLESVTVVRPTSVDPSQAVAFFPWLDLSTIDVLRREADPSRELAVESIASTVPLLLDELVAAAERAELPPKHRDWPSAGWAVCPKGLDLRNLGWSSEASRPFLFDSGPIRIAPVEEAAAKLVCSAALLDFGHPVRRTLRGVDEELVEALVGSIAPRTHRRAIDHELGRLRRHRLEEPKARSRSERLVIRPATAVLVRHYWRSIRKWTDAHIPEGTQPRDAPISMETT